MIIPCRANAHPGIGFFSFPLEDVRGGGILVPSRGWVHGNRRLFRGSQLKAATESLPATTRLRAVNLPRGTS